MAEFDSDVKQRVNELTTASARWTTNYWKRLSATRSPQEEDLEQLYKTTQMAYEKELVDIPNAHHLHVEAERAWTKFSKAFVLAYDLRRFNLCTKFIKQRAALHQERVKTLERFLDVKSTGALTEPLPLHPAMDLALRGLSDVLSPGALRLATAEEARERDSWLLFRETWAKGQQSSYDDGWYTPRLNSSLPLQYYRILREGTGIYGPPTYSVVTESSLATKGQKQAAVPHTVLVLQTAHAPGRFPQPVTQAFCWRPGEYPAVAMRIRSWGGDRTFATVGLQTDVYGLNVPITIIEEPDALGRARWDTSRRLNYGGRRFAWKGRTKQEKVPTLGYKNFEVVEFSNDTIIEPEGKKKKKDPVVKTDDASSTKLFWTEDKGERLVCMAGLDPILKEYLMAVSILKLAINKYAMSAHQDDAVERALAAQGVKMAVKGGVAVLQIILGNM